ncbi:hypothetical protein G3570_02955 [Balneolaceae bacterium YR4-1]|uniref:Uncharacterized protein n=1 Tax=Halalkalibaculum roseum TaxID=2709311 RepID=A0A6M1T0F9_9BACT|nr:hypothetical protein [Halalkalibaculum roseum]NGP75575.1 hypothetical protein [Halalkalibaculum roseum]
MLFLIVFNNASYGQDNEEWKLEKVITIYSEEGEENTVINFNEDSTHAFFRIVNKGMETEEKRDHAIKRHKESRLPFPNFYTDLYTISKPKNINSLEGIDYITVEEYRNGGYYLSNSVTLICEMKNGTFLKWENAYHMAYE